MAVALWIAATHAQAAWQHAPRLVIRAPVKRCGKSRLLDMVEGTCHNPLITVNASPAAVYRAIGTDTPPTLLVDEADATFGKALKGDERTEHLRGILNAGFGRDRPYVRYDVAQRRNIPTPTFAMAVIAGIGDMPDTIEDRAVAFTMRRKAPGETVAPFRHRRDRCAVSSVAGQLARWLGKHLAELERAESFFDNRPLQFRHVVLVAGNRIGNECYAALKIRDNQGAVSCGLVLSGPQLVFHRPRTSTARACRLPARSRP